MAPVLRLSFIIYVGGVCLNPFTQPTPRPHTAASFKIDIRGVYRYSCTQPPPRTHTAASSLKRLMRGGRRQQPPGSNNQPLSAQSSKPGSSSQQQQQQQQQQQHLTVANIQTSGSTSPSTSGSMLSLLPLPVLEPGHTHKTLNNYLGIGIDAKVALEFHCIRLEREREKERERKCVCVNLCRRCGGGGAVPLNVSTYPRGPF